MTSLGSMVSFTGFDRIDTLLTQPLMIVAGSNAGSLWHSQVLHAKAATRQKELFIVDGATHMDLYDGTDACGVHVRKRGHVDSEATATVRDAACTRQVLH